MRRSRGRSRDANRTGANCRSGKENLDYSEKVCLPRRAHAQRRMGSRQTDRLAFIHAGVDAGNPGHESKTDLLSFTTTKARAAPDAAAYFQGQGFENVKSLRGGIDAWSAEVDSHCLDITSE